MYIYEIVVCLSAFESKFTVQEIPSYLLTILRTLEAEV